MGADKYHKIHALAWIFFASDISQGTVFGAIGAISMVIFTLGIELAQVAYVEGGAGIFNLLRDLSWMFLVRGFHAKPSEGL